MMTKKWIKRSWTISAIVKKYPVGSEVTMKQAEEAYVELSPSPKSEASKRTRARHVYLRMVDEGIWKGNTSPYIKVEQGDGIFYWAEPGTFQVEKLKSGAYMLRFKTANGVSQSINFEHIRNLKELNSYV